jgi:DNA-binding transcriptional MerR regulator
MTESKKSKGKTKSASGGAAKSRGGRRGSRRARGRKTPDDDLDLGSDKLYFKIGEVADIVDVPAYVLRYWENEFRAIRPQKSRSHQRVYRRKDVEALLKIKHLLYTRKFTIAGARQELEKGGATLEKAPANGAYLLKQSYANLREQLDSLASLLRADDESGALAADPAAYLKQRGGARAILAGKADHVGSSQPLLDRPEREAH